MQLRRKLELMSDSVLMRQVVVVVALTAFLSSPLRAAAGSGERTSVSAPFCSSDMFLSAPSLALTAFYCV